MKHLVAMTLCLSFASQAFAVNMPTCKIQTINDAEACMRKVVRAYPEYNMPNEGMASKNKDALAKVMNALGSPAGAVAALKADYVGTMVEYGDEYHIYYFVMKKGVSKPVELYDLNVVDLAYELVSPLKVNDFFFGKTFGDTWLRKDILEAIIEYESKEK